MSSSSELVCTFVAKKKIDFKSLISFFSKIQNTEDYKILSKRALDLYCGDISKKKKKSLESFALRTKLIFVFKILNGEKRKYF